ncbi:hypothetical protein EG831_02690 [bacterium]|nr:hypothetical protein [bacterium]
MNEFNRGILALFVFLLIFEVFVEDKRKSLWAAVFTVLFAIGSVGAALVGMEKMSTSLVLSAVMAALCLGYLWYERRFRRAEKLARKHAVQLKLSVGDVERVMPARNGEPVKIAVARYGLPRRQGVAPKGWTLSRTDGAEGADLGHGWKLKTAGGEAAEAMKAILRGIAAQARGEQLEFEADEAEVRAYWKEWGGTEHVDDIHHWLLVLSQY